MKREDLRKILRGKCISDESCEAAIDELLNLHIVSDSEGDWFNEYSKVDDFLFEELDKKGKEFPIITELKSSPNTIEAIKLLCSGR